MSNNFITEVNKYIGQVVYVKYYDSNNGDMLTEQAVISGFILTHLKIVTAFNNTLISKGLAIRNIEYIITPDGQDLIYNQDFNKQKTLKIH